MAQQPPGTDKNWPYGNRQGGRGKNKPGHTEPDKMINNVTLWTEIRPFYIHFFDWYQRDELTDRIFIEKCLHIAQYIFHVNTLAINIYRVIVFSCASASAKPLAANYRSLYCCAASAKSGVGISLLKSFTDDTIPLCCARSHLNGGIGRGRRKTRQCQWGW